MGCFNAGLVLGNFLEEIDGCLGTSDHDAVFKHVLAEWKACIPQKTNDYWEL